MLGKSRTTNTIYNFIANVGYQTISIILRFIVRTIFVYSLSISYLGISSLFANIISILSLAELGVGSAMVYSMYKPLAEKDEKKLAQLLNYYRIVYRTIAFIILVIGVLIIPFLSKIIHLQTEISNLYLYYILYLLDTCSSYLFVYRALILTADQKEYIINIYKSSLEILQAIIQSIVLLIFKSFIWYLIVQIIFSIAKNVVIARHAEKAYEFIKNKSIQLDNTSKREIWGNIKSMFFYKMGGVVLNNTDQIYISALESTDMVGIYSNYLLSIGILSSISSSIFISVRTSIGNLITENDRTKQFYIFKILNIIGFWIYGISGIVFSLLINEFIELWLGNKFLLDNNIVIVIAVSFYITGVLYPIWCYRETIGLFKQTQYILFFSSIINLVLSYFLGQEFGLVGILSATVIARLTTNIWYEPYKLYKLYFKESSKSYFQKQILNIIFIALLYIVIYYILSLISFTNQFVNIIMKFLIAVILCVGFFMVFSYFTGEWNMLKSTYHIYIKQKSIKRNRK